MSYFTPEDIDYKLRNDYIFHFDRKYHKDSILRLILKNSVIILLVTLISSIILTLLWIIVVDIILIVILVRRFLDDRERAFVLTPEEIIIEKRGKIEHRFPFMTVDNLEFFNRRSRYSCSRLKIIMQSGRNMEFSTQDWDTLSSLNPDAVIQKIIKFYFVLVQRKMIGN